MNTDDIMKDVAMHTAKAVAHYWQTRAMQRRKQEDRERRIRDCVAPSQAERRWMGSSISLPN
jgi:hypothetical protein